MAYVCAACSTRFDRWANPCPSCAKWNTLHEGRKEDEPVRDFVKAEGLPPIAAQTPPPIRQPRSIVSSEAEHVVVPRLRIGRAPYDRLFGGGIAERSINLLTGWPGIGKSTAAAQLTRGVASHLGTAALLAFSEATEEQALELVARVHARSEYVRVLYVTDTAELLDELDTLRPRFAVIDSVQGFRDSDVGGKAGSTPQILHLGHELVVRAKRAQGTTLLLLGQVNKDGEAAGPKALEHLVDATFTFSVEGQRLEEDPVEILDDSVRVLRCTKNRFGPLGAARFLMQKDGSGLVEAPPAGGGAIVVPIR